MNSKFKIPTLILVLLVWSAEVSRGQVKLPRLLSDGAVLQRGTEQEIRGWATAGELVSVEFNDSTYRTRVDTNGDWRILLPKLAAGGPFEMQIRSTDTVTIHDILVGDVWVCSGQSNMELPMKRVAPIYEAEIANSANPFIREFHVPQVYDFRQPLKDVRSGSWKSANPENVLDFSAVGYFFGKEIYDMYKVPVGLINASLGGSPAEAWMSEDALKEFPTYYKEAQRFKDDALIKNIESEDNRRIGDWYHRLTEKDEGFKNPRKPWTDPALNTDKWSTMTIPGYWANTRLGVVNGVVWFRREFDVPASAAAKQAELILGRIVDADSVYVNGMFVGTTSYQYPPRRYDVPPNVLKEGRNTIVVRVISNAGLGGFVPDKQYEIIVDNESIDLKGLWRYCPGARMEPLASQTFIRWKPLGLYNGMIAPLLNSRIKGVVWYQGESNADRPGDYRELFSTLIRDWRKNWGQGDFPFLFVQLPNFMEARSEPSQSNWALLREAQLKTLALSNTAMAVTIDIGEWNDVHPLDKKDVGKRLALAARRLAYGDARVVSSGPIYHSMKIVGNRIIVLFDDVGTGLVARGGKLGSCAIAGNDRKFVWASAKIENDQVVVWSDQISNPVAVRYAWADNPEGADLYNREGLPASPFRTDNW